GADRLIEGLWGDDPRAGAATALQSLASRLRTALAPERPVESRHGGYLLAADPERVDAVRFERLLGDGRRALDAGEHARAAALLREALELWRGDPLSDLRSAGGDHPGGVHPAIARLRELRLSAH